jgi:hypothetical protein
MFSLSLTSNDLLSHDCSDTGGDMHVLLFFLLLCSFLTNLFIFALYRWVRGFYKVFIQIIKSYTRLNNKTEKSFHKMLKSFLWLRTLLFSVFESSLRRCLYLFSYRFMVLYSWNGYEQGEIICLVSRTHFNLENH